MLLSLTIIPIYFIISKEWKSYKLISFDVREVSSKMISLITAPLKRLAEINCFLVVYFG